MWGGCDDCGINVTWTVHPDQPSTATLPPAEGLATFACPSCGRDIHEGSDTLIDGEPEVR